MARPKNITPAYLKHAASGRGYAVFNGKWHYFGPFDDPESKSAYLTLLSRWAQNGQQLLDDMPTGLSVNEAILAYVKFATEFYRNRRRSHEINSRIARAMRPLRAAFGLTPAAAFGPKAIKAIRATLIGDGLSRKTINHVTAEIRRMFKWAASEELVPSAVWHGLTTVSGLRSGESAAPEPKKVLPVPDEHIAAIREYVSKPVWALIELQRLTGMRAGEAVIMRGRDLDMTGKLWIYRPAFHKTDRHGHSREIMLGRQAQAIIKPFLREATEEYLFRPVDAVAEVAKRRSETRRTPKWPSHMERNAAKRKTVRRRSAGERYSTDSYRRAIIRACRQVGVPEWGTHQLRHAYATRVRKQFGIEAAAILLGHAGVAQAEIYAERDAEVAKAVARKIG